MDKKVLFSLLSIDGAIHTHSRSFHYILDDAELTPSRSFQIINYQQGITLMAIKELP